MKMQSVSATIADRLSHNEPTISIMGYVPAGACMAKVVLNVIHTSESAANPELVRTALTRKLGGRLEGIRGSFRSLSKNSIAEELVGLVGVVRKSIAVGEELPNGFVATASNMFVDDEQGMWHLKTTSGGKVLVKDAGVEDDAQLISMLSSMSSGNPLSTGTQQRVRSLCSSADTVAGGDAVIYASDDNRLTTGIVVATDDEEGKAMVLSADQEAPQIIDKTAVLETHEAPEIKLGEDEAVAFSVSAARGIDAQVLTNYYSKIYAQHPEFWSQMKQRIAQHAFM